MVDAAKLSVDTNNTANDLAEAIFGAGITIVDATYSGDPIASGIYTGGATTSPGAVPSETGVILSTGDATDFTNASGEANQQANLSTNTNGVDGDGDLNSIAGQSTFDAAILEATFVPAGDELTMQIVFSSEEYLEFVNSGFNDAVGVWVNGTKAELTIGDGDISIDNINTTSNENLFIDNTNDDYNTEMDGLTIVMTLKAPVNAGVNNTIKIGIADAGDSIYDSNLLIVGDSVQTAVVAMDDDLTIGPNDPKTFDILSNDTNNGSGTLTITQINGVDVVAGDTVTLPTGEQITLNADGTIEILPDGDFGTNVFTYTVVNGDGVSDQAFVDITTAPCFTRGTDIETRDGFAKVEDLQIGDEVRTLDSGYQPVRWVGCSKTKAIGRHAPVRIQANTFGTHEEISVSPMHRVMLSETMSEALFGEAEVLAPAKFLLSHDKVSKVETGNDVEYFHMMFEKHEVVNSNGLMTESFFPGGEALNAIEAEVQEEIYDLFPELQNEDSRDVYGSTARMTLKQHEVKVLLND